MKFLNRILSFELVFLFILKVTPKNLEYMHTILLKIYKMDCSPCELPIGHKKRVSFNKKKIEKLLFLLVGNGIPIGFYAEYDGTIRLSLSYLLISLFPSVPFLVIHVTLTH